MATTDQSASLVVCDAGPLIHLSEIRAHSTIGILIRAIRRNQRTKPQVLALLHSLPASSTLHLKRSLLDSVKSKT